MRGSAAFTRATVDEKLVSQPHTQVAWQATRISDDTDTCRPQSPHFAAKPTSNSLDSEYSSGPCELSR
jgi:hypothetical protein